MLKKYTLNIFIAMILGLLFFVLALRGRPWLLITSFWPFFHITFLILAVIGVIIKLYFKKQSIKLFNIAVKMRYVMFPFIGFALALSTSHFLFKSRPHIIDASHFLFLSKQILSGKLTIQATELYEFFETTFLVRRNGELFSLFLPGYSFLLAIFHFFGLSSVFAPLCNGVAILLTGKVADRVSNRSVSFLAMFFASFSSFYILMSASYMAHPFNMVLMLSSLYLFLTSGRSLKKLFLSGTLLSYMIFIRPQNALFAFVPMLFFLILKEKNYRKAALFSVPFLFFSLLLLLYNYSFTGNPMVFPQDLYFFIREPQEFCHRLGFGKGCPNTDGAYLPDGGHNINYAMWLSFTRLNMLVFKLTSHPILFIFPVVLFIRSWKRHVFC